MDGDRIRLFGPSQDGHLTIRGGATGISVQLEELTAGAEKLEALAGNLAFVEQEAGRILDQLCWLDRQPPWSAVPYLAAVRNSQWRVQAARAEMQRISSQIRACIRDYQDAEWRANVGRFLGLATAEELGRSWNISIASGVPDGRTTERIIALMQLTAPEVRARIGQEPFVRDALMFLVANYIPRDITVRREESVQVELDSSPAGLLERIRQIDARGAGYIEVVEVDNGGEKVFLVVVPGTQAAGTGAGHNNPFDEAGIIEGLLYESADVNTAVLDALAAAGAEPGAPVIAVEYSQGGIHAMNLAADPRVSDRYDMKYVLTAGSPVAGIVLEEGVSALHLEHEADWVPGSDGAANPETRSRVTVTMANPWESGGDKGLGPGHRLDGYQEGARLVASSDDPALLQSSAVLGTVLGAGGAATATRFSLARTRAASSVLTPQDPRTHERGRGGR
ncbi:hypothetical protein FDW83_08300 [Pseudarthrobacter sp. NamE2]|uniref:hypothetical protein n=1 Tax=Pseudarthrobacter sp. NamE2 TaxID=2576838 RepID=UPI0010FCE289|nr:hypothetical protein [Pseudarthrobacter sp. NamE2]TLM83968.1 hypothetical protein FDW83_08300 [Pseudarthrobacter sp. NamE2]